MDRAWHKSTKNGLVLDFVSPLDISNVYPQILFPYVFRRYSGGWAQKCNLIINDRDQSLLSQVERQQLVYFSFRGTVWEMWELLLDKVSNLKISKKMAIR